MVSSNPHMQILVHALQTYTITHMHIHMHTKQGGGEAKKKPEFRTPLNLLSGLVSLNKANGLCALRAL